MGTHWNENVVILTKFSSLAALEVVKMTTSSAASDQNVIKWRHFCFSAQAITAIQLIVSWRGWKCWNSNDEVAADKHRTRTLAVGVWPINSDTALRMYKSTVYSRERGRMLIAIGMDNSLLDCTLDNLRATERHSHQLQNLMKTTTLKRHIFNGHAQVWIDQRSKWWHLFEIIGRFDIHRCHSWFPHPSHRCKRSGNCDNLQGKFQTKSVILRLVFDVHIRYATFGIKSYSQKRFPE